MCVVRLQYGNDNGSELESSLVLRALELKLLSRSGVCLDQRGDQIGGTTRSEGTLDRRYFTRSNPFRNLGIYVSEEFEPLSRLPSNMLFLVGKPATPVEAETIRWAGPFLQVGAILINLSSRNTFWM